MPRGLAAPRTGARLHVWYETLRHPKLKANANFVAFARLTVKTASRLCKAKGNEVSAVPGRGKRWGAAMGSTVDRGRVAS